MKKLYTIIKNKTGKVRTTLHIEDLALMPDLEDYGLMRKEEFDQGTVLVFKEPIPVPKFNKFYASRISRVDDPYLRELTIRLLYLNPSPDALLIKKLAEYIILRFSQIEMKPSKVKSSELIATPILTFALVETAIKITMFYMKEDYKPTTGVYLLFSRDNTFSANFKRSTHTGVRMGRIKYHMGSAIHIVAEQLMDNYPRTKITLSRVESTKLVTTKKGPASIRSIRNNVRGDTIRDLADHTEGATFGSPVTEDKYNEYLECSDQTLASTAARLNISKSTVIEFRKLKNKEDDNNSI